MAGSRIPGPICGSRISHAIDDGTNALCASPIPGPIGQRVETGDMRAREWMLLHTSSLKSLLEQPSGHLYTQQVILSYQRLIQSERSSLALSALGRISEIKREVWITLDREQRLTALREVHRAYLAAYSMGPPTLRFELIPQHPPVITLGQYDPNTGVLTIDDRLVMTTEPRPEVAVVFLVNTIVHESRHYLQWRVACHPKSFPSFHQAIEWSRAYREQASPTADYKKYRSNAIESDAFISGNEAAKYLYPDTNYFEAPDPNKKPQPAARNRISKP